MFRQGRSILFLIGLKIGPMLNLTSHWFKFTRVFMLLYDWILKLDKLKQKGLWLKFTPAPKLIG